MTVIGYQGDEKKERERERYAYRTCFVHVTEFISSYHFFYPRHIVNSKSVHASHRKYVYEFARDLVLKCRSSFPALLLSVQSDR